VFCQIEWLRDCFPPDIRRALKELPKSLDETYERILLGIGSAKRGYAHCLLQCLAVSIRPLHVEELAEVLAIRLDEGEDSEYDSDWRPEDARQAVLSACSSLITIVNVNGLPIVQLSHFSVKEFLMSSRLANAGEQISLYHTTPSSAHAFLSRSCLSILLSLGDDVDKSAVQQRPFAMYAARYWVDHTKFEGASLGILDLMERLFDPDQPFFATWVWIYDVDRPWKGFMPTVRPTEPEAKPLYYVALCGFRSLMEHLCVTHQIDVNAMGGDHGTALNAALSRGELEIARTLLRDGANINAVDIAGFSSLYRAAEAGHRAVVEFLLEHQADINIQHGEEVETSLHVAVWARELDICRLLLKHGSDVASKMWDGWTPLHIASRYGYFGIAQELVAYGADVNNQEANLWTSLHMASVEHLEIVQLLVRHGAELDMTNANQITALHIASGVGNLKIARFLIEQGANAMCKDEGGELPLHKATKNNLPDLVEIFVEVGVDVNVRNANEETPPGLASGFGNFKVAHFLIEHGADVNCFDKRGCTPLHAAAHYGHLDIVQLLLDHVCGLSLQVRNREHDTPLMLASLNGHLEVSRFLIEHHSDVNSIGDGGWTSLHFASQSGHTDIIQLLLNNGADVNVQKEDLWTPLHLASANGHLKAVELLIRKGAGIDMRDEDQKTPLDLASGNAVLEAARLLIKSGSNVNSQDDMGCTPSHTAVRNGHLSLVELFLDSGADVDMRNNSGKTLFDLAQENGKLEVASLLARRSGDLCALDTVGSAPSNAGAQDILPQEIAGEHMDGDPSSTSDYDESDSLHSASVDGLIYVVQRLLDRGADVNERNERLQTPLDLASEHGNLAIAKTLIEYGADVNSRDNFGWTPLHRAAATRYRHAGVVELLLVNGADINATEREGYTALHFASSYGNLEIVQLLLERGANMQIQDVYGRKSSQLALQWGQREIVQFLTEHDVGGI
jgi:ankyrin repeat protein